MSQPPYPPPSRPEPRPEHPGARAEQPYDPAHPGHATEPAYDPAYPPQPTGPMDGSAPAPPPLPGPEVSTGPRVGARARSSADRAALTAAVLGVVGFVLLVVGLSVSTVGITLWTAVPAWSVFAVLAALVAQVPHVPSRGGLSRGQAWQVGAAGAGGLALFWLLVVVFPGGGATDRGFVLTLATALVAGGVWLRRRGS
ncbi:hypothetical protein [Klenkia sp. PcliD-1-E]|uniref:hypothetical protein n=1 Tax=Klenkia sp. PcliD-1-E TaxID=2954492 RepID=UPI002096F535|nr:hypothetical protein [Klenkia sp. PcliD-1-E]MCO7221001.1 hypothetical protein [Klenkia sp. PcliD-1-E]